METTKSKRITVYESDDVKVDVEYNQFFFIVHLPHVTKFTREMYLKMKIGFEDLKDFAETIGYASVFAAIALDNEKTSKLAGRLGFEFRGTADGFEVYELKLKETQDG